MTDNFDEEIAGAGGSSRTPPYIPFRTFLTFLEELKVNGLPPQIDRSVLTRFSGGTASQLLGGIKSLGLVNERNQPTPALVSIVDHYQTDEFKQSLRNLLEWAYPYVFELNLQTATPAMFADAFKKNVDAREDVLRKCRTFFLHACRDAGVELGQRLLNGSVPRTGAISAKRKKPAKLKQPDEIISPIIDQKKDNGSGGNLHPFIEGLLKTLPAPETEWSSSDQAKWLQTAASIFGLIYKSDGSVIVAVKE